MLRYYVYEGIASKKESTKAINALGITGSSYVVTKLKKGVRYFFIVVATNSAGLGSASNQLSAELK
jgi:hypothetical protein